MLLLQHNENLAIESTGQRFVRHDLPRNDIFIRIEDKYCLPTGIGPEALSLISRCLAPCQPDPKTQVTRIETGYFDSSGLSSYRTHFSSPVERFKLRSR